MTKNGKLTKLPATAEDVLVRAKAIWKSNPTKGVFARDATGASVPPESSRAVCYCALGALHRARKDLGVTNIPRLYDSLPYEVVAMNDAGELTDAHWDEAIAKARAAEGGR